jgi:hypothetical protein
VQKTIVGLPFSSLSPHHLQRRFAVLLSMMLCFWMFASATHFHLSTEDVSGHHTSKDLCGVCASLPSAGAPPTVFAFIATADRPQVSAPAAILPLIPAPAAASYRSRAPPAV